MRCGRASSDGEIASCQGVLAELRPALAGVGTQDFVDQVRRMEIEGFALARLVDAEGVVLAVAGYRLYDTFAHGPILYVDDLVTAAAQRSRGAGRELLAWLTETARRAGCHSIQLDSGTQRVDAHRFYLRERFEIRSFRFVRRLDAE